VSLPSRLLGANPSIQVSTLLSGTLTTPSAKQTFAGPAYVSLATATGTGSNSSITFSSIPQTYQHLQIRAIVKTDSGTTLGVGNLAFNGDGGTNYTRHRLYGDGTSVVADSSLGASSIVGAAWGAGSPSGSTNIVGPSIIDIHDYASTTKNKVIRSVGARNYADSNGFIQLLSGLWLNTNAITSITFTITGGSNFTSQTQFALYGIQG
jgi:hypothetical protein